MSSEKEEPIFFYGCRNEFGCFSNFYPKEFKDKTRTYCCSEQYYMFRKARTFEPGSLTDPNWIGTKILEENSAKKIKALGRKIKNFDEKIWEETRYHHMMEALRLKFADPELREILLSTGDRDIYEASPFDRIWGIGIGVPGAKKLTKSELKKRGQNLLGRALMETRENIRSELSKGKSKKK